MMANHLELRHTHRMLRIRSLHVAVMLVLCNIPAFSQPKPCPTLETNVQDSTFKPGQVWSYTTRPNETGSTITILQVDRSEKIGIIIHVRLDGLNAHNPRGERVPSIGHMPFTRDALIASTSRLLRTQEQPPTMEGYENWRSACGGVYTISVRDAVDIMEKTLNRS
jgi:hypothetical protein